MATITDPVERTRYLLARVSAFRTWVGATAGDESAKLAAALAKISAVFAVVSAVTPPFATVEYDDLEWKRQGTGGGCYLKDASVTMAFYGACTATTPAQEITQLQAFETTTVGIVQGFLSLSGYSTGISWDRVRRIRPAGLLETSSKQNWLVVAFKCSGMVPGSQTET
jgi:hypothetical protein